MCITTAEASISMQLILNLAYGTKILSHTTSENDNKYIYVLQLSVDFLLRKIFCGKVSSVSANEITSLIFPREIFLKRTLTIIHAVPFRQLEDK